MTENINIFDLALVVQVTRVTTLVLKLVNNGHLNNRIDINPKIKTNLVLKIILNFYFQSK